MSESSSPGSLERRLCSDEIVNRISRIDAVLPELHRRLDPCQLCPRRCRAHRLGGELGECGLDGRLRVASIARHKGEEPPISGLLGAINVFFSGCNLHCLHCQNWPVSQNHVGRIRTVAEVGETILRRWSGGAQTLGWVTPTPQLVPALEAYRFCLANGLDLPLVHNGGGYESTEIIQLLSGIVDIWLPDAKTAALERGKAIHGAYDYYVHNIAAIQAMLDLVKSGWSRAVIVRHLILPDGLEDSRRVLEILRSNLGDSIYLSLMMQYFPTYRTENHPVLGRRLTEVEYQSIVEFAHTLGYERGWIQDYEEEDGIPLHCLQ